jgi:hypothetical protein
MPARAEALRHYNNPDLVIDHPALDVEDRIRARHVERQGLDTRTESPAALRELIDSVIMHPIERGAPRIAIRGRLAALTGSRFVPVWG